MKKITIYLLPILFILISCKEEKKVSEKNIIDKELTELIKHLDNSIDYNNQAIKVINSGNSKRITENEINEYKKLLKKAVIEAKKVDLKLLDEIKNGYGNAYKNKYILGLENQLNGFESHNDSLTQKGQKLYDEYVAWIKKNGL